MFAASALAHPALHNKQHKQRMQASFSAIFKLHGRCSVDNLMVMNCIAEA